jgi:uncharacterized DUF497 family protein
MALRFEWDEAKNLSNFRKHGVRFEEATEVFFDPLYVSVLEREVAGEERWQTYGRVNGALLMMVANTVWEEGDTEVVRIISARYATKRETRDYEDKDG